MQALLISTHPQETALITYILQQTGFEVRQQQDLPETVRSWIDRPLDLIWIACAINFVEARQAVSDLRMQTVASMIFTIDGLTELEHAELLDAGADLILARASSPLVVMAQIRMLMRRSASLPFFSMPSLARGAIRLNPQDHTVSIADQPARHLTQLEFRLLYTLMTHPQTVIPAENIVESVWGFAGEGNRELVRGLVQRLRSKIEPDPHAPQYILTEPGIGYYLAGVEDREESRS